MKYIKFLKIHLKKDSEIDLFKYLDEKLVFKRY